MSIEAMNHQTEVPNNQIPKNTDALKKRHLSLVPELAVPFEQKIDIEQLKHKLDAKDEPTSIDVITIVATQIDALPQELDEVEKIERDAAIHDIEQAYALYDELFLQGSGNTPAKRRQLFELTEDCDNCPILRALELVAQEAKDTPISKMVIDATRIARIAMLIEDPDETKLRQLLND